MDKLWAIIRREYIERVRTKWFVIATLLGPVLFLAITVLPVLFISKTKASAETTNIAIIDATGAGLGSRVAAQLADSATARPVVTVTLPSGVAAAESLASRGVMDKARQGYLVLDSATLAGRAARYAGRNTTTVPDMQRLGTAVDKALMALRLEGTGFTQARIDSLTRVDVELEKTQLSDKGREKSGAGSTILGLIVAFLLYMVLVLYGQTVLRSVIEEKSTRVAEVVISSVRPEILLAGKIIGIGGVAVTQMGVWMASSAWIGANVVPMIVSRSSRAGATAADSVARTNDLLSNMPSFSLGLLVALLLYFVLGFIFYSCLYAAVGSTVNSESEAQQASTPVVMLLVLSAVCIQPVALAPQSTLAIVTSMLPISSPIMMPMRMSLVSVPAWQVTLSLAGMLVSCVAAIWLSARIYRVGLLMYGKRPTVRELLKWLRYS
ncbi:MAG: ABC transporter permease [Gemmatimonadaceae bacterium]|nr:ABC transporter permease [Gemmatimonadaceae bacterium]